MNGSGSRDAFGQPPWDPAEPVPDLEDTQALPGLGDASAQADVPSHAGASWQAGFRHEAGRAAPGDGGDRDAGRPGLAEGQRSAFEPAGGDDGDSGQRQRGRGRDAAGAGKGTPKRGAAKSGKGKRQYGFWRELPVLIVVVFVFTLLIKAFAIQTFFIPTGSMENTLEIGDRVLANKIVYHLRPIHRGDIVIFDGSGSWDFIPPHPAPSIFSRALGEVEGLIGISQDPHIYIKRVIGLPGDHVACCNVKGQVTVNGVPLSETSYLYPGNTPSRTPFSITVPAGGLWVMGDHRSVSYDSRGHMGDPGGGTIPESAVIGRAFVIIWPPSQAGFLNIPATFEQPRLNASAAAAGGSRAALLAALDNGTPVRQDGSPLPVALAFTGAVPVTWLQRKARRRLKSRRTRSGR